MSVKHSDICITLDAVGFHYGDLSVLENITTQIPQGDFVGIIGPNGGGKTTLLKIILGLLTPDSGEVKIFGHSVAEAKEHFEIGYVPQHIAQLNFSFPTTVLEVVRSGLTRRRGVGHFLTKSDTAVARETLALVGIADLADRPLDELSGGQRQRVFIARALAGSPRLLILDEPTAGVDSNSEKQLEVLLADLNKKQGMTIITVSHDVDAVLSQVKHVLCVNRSLVCHTPSKKFNRDEYASSLYANRQTVDHIH